MSESEDLNKALVEFLRARCHTCRAEVFLSVLEDWRNKKEIRVKWEIGELEIKKRRIFESEVGSSLLRQMFVLFIQQLLEGRWFYKRYDWQITFTHDPNTKLFVSAKPKAPLAFWHVSQNLDFYFLYF